MPFTPSGPFGVLSKVAPASGGGWDLAFEAFYPHIDVSEVDHDYSNILEYAPGHWLRPLAARPDVIVAFEPVTTVAKETGLTGTPNFTLRESLLSVDSRIGVGSGYCPPFQGKYEAQGFFPEGYFERQQGPLSGYCWGNAVWRLSGSTWSALINGEWTTVNTDWVLWGGGLIGDASPNSHVKAVVQVDRVVATYMPTVIYDRDFGRHDMATSNYSGTPTSHVLLRNRCFIYSGPNLANAGECFCGGPDDWADWDLVHQRDYSIDPGARQPWDVPWQGGGGANPADGPSETDATRYWMITMGRQGADTLFRPLGLYRASIGADLLPGPWTRVAAEPADPNSLETGWSRRPDLAVSRNAAWLLEGLRTLGYTDDYTRILRVDKGTGEQVEIERIRLDNAEGAQHVQMFRAFGAAWK